MQFLITTTFAVILLVGVASSCPSVCRCTQAYRRVTVDCSNQRLWSIPKDIPNNTINLYLQNNEIPHIDSTDFQNMTVLSEIDLSFNQITAIKSDTFKGLPKLYRLNLESNKISVIEDNALNSPSLGYIDLESNQIPSIKSDTFKDMPLLSNIRLRDNKISVIEENAFNNLPRLRFLYLYNNKITSIKSGIFNNLPGLIRIYLSYNKISVMEDNAFSNYNLPALLLLDLSYNEITSIKSDTFKDLLNLESLNMKNNNISFVSDKAFVNLPQLKRLRFDMYCGCNSNIPFWTWLKVNQKFSLSIGCYDYNGLYLENVQPSNFYKCYAPSTPITTTSPTTATSTNSMTTGRTTASPMGRTTSTLTRRAISTPMSRTTITTTSAARITRKKLEAPPFVPRVVIRIAIGAGSLAGGILLFCVICRLWRRSNDKDAKFEQQQDKINSVMPAIPSSTLPQRATEKSQYII